MKLEVVKANTPWKRQPYHLREVGQKRTLCKRQQVGRAPVRWELLMESRQCRSCRLALAGDAH